jgi:hypothetical protein
MAEPSEDLTEAEMVEILKSIAREGQNAAARIAAIKQLREMGVGHGAEQPEGFEALDAGDEVAARRRNRAQAA